jgi:arylformamidase
MKTNVVDLSHVMIPKKMNRNLEIKLLVGDTRPWGIDDPEAKPLVTEHPVDQRETVPVPDGNYFLMSEIWMNTHAGTHIEIPYHCLKGKEEFTKYPLERLFGQTVLLKLRGYGPGTCLSLENIQRAAERAGGIQKDDIVFIETGYDQYFFTDVQTYLQAPYPSEEGVEWIVGHGIKIFGMDVGMIERPRNPYHRNHLLIMEPGASLIENLAHLDRLRTLRFMTFCFPLAIQGADSMPIRVVALEEVEG